ncbi:MAG: alpha-hydroxy-acid oxidizing protein [Deltaproteobacteria bacterium]|nr:alpha-hydroxy-acid oxidizing protein [Deltaproteobacteria bacterium]
MKAGPGAEAGSGSGRRGMAAATHRVNELKNHPGRGGCGVGAIAHLRGATRAVIDQALAGLVAMEHRGGRVEDTGDGAGMLIDVDRDFFSRFIAPGRHLPDGEPLAVGVAFFPRGEATNLPGYQREIDRALRQEGLSPLGWRRVPVAPDALGARAREASREIWQVLIGEGMRSAVDFAPTLFRVKATLEAQFRELYLASFAPRVVVYKALATGHQLARFYEDLVNPSLRARVAIFHRRFSTNTFSNWYLAQPFRLLGHNGEINSIAANRNAVRNLEREQRLPAVLMPQGSDSADLDRMLELLTVRGLPLDEALLCMMPAAWRDLPAARPEVVRFYQSVSRVLGSLGAWEGPAAVVATDGRKVVAMLDRMGLRPLRYVITHDDRVIVASEIGAIEGHPGDVREAGQLDPGEAISIDLDDRRISRAHEILERVLAGTRFDLGRLGQRSILAFSAPPASAAEFNAKAQRHQDPNKEATSLGVSASLRQIPDSAPPNALLTLFGWQPDRVRTARHMAKEAKEPVISMGFDRPLAVFSRQRPPLFKYMKQIIAVVTNPPIDPLREGSAIDLGVFLGRSPRLTDDLADVRIYPQVRHPTPFLTEAEVGELAAPASRKLPKTVVLSSTFKDQGGAKTVAARIAELARDAVEVARAKKASILVLSDRALADGGAWRESAAAGDFNAEAQRGKDAKTETSSLGVSAPLRQDPAPPILPLPILLVTSAVHNALTHEGLRRRVSIVVETGEVSEGHDAAVLIANGATAVAPYLLERIAAAAGEPSGVKNLFRALDATLRRIMSKMGITSIDAYRGSRLFEAIGVSPALVDHHLPGTVSKLGGVDLGDIYEDIVARARDASTGAPLTDVDAKIYRKEVWQALQFAARGNPGAYAEFIDLVARTPAVYLRDLLEFRKTTRPIPLDDVAPETTIIRDTLRGAAMSHGALHRTAHRAIAGAFNSFESFSNSGEGGEDVRRDRGGIWEADRSRARQVASGRFGVDARYLVHADEIEIKIGQGAKPGEGGQLPAEKVVVEIATIRKTRPGIALISPPPHHDIYSIEDLALLIDNLKAVNPRARISVKCPATTDLGTIVVGVAKAGADVIAISGFEGGTGAASQSSIEHAGLPLERGLCDAHQALTVNGLRESVVLRADGGIKTGADVVKLIALGADQVAMGTALMMAEQCIYCHGCAKGNCPAGITTQDDTVAERLMVPKARGERDLFILERGGSLPDEEERYEDAKRGVQTYLLALAGDVRARLAALGLKHPRELRGRVDLLEQVPSGFERADKVELTELLVDPRTYSDSALAPNATVTSCGIGPTGDATTLNRRIVDVVRAHRAGPIDREFRVTTLDRACGATLAGEMSLKPPAHPIVLRFTGNAGQGFAFACVDGLTMKLEGFANDVVGEVMSGGRIIVVPPREVLEAGASGGLSLVGNAAGYGMTGGELFVAGRAGQRLGVRMSDGVIVCEGAGKYAFEYMTGGVGVVLGPVGPVFASGQTGGVIYVWQRAVPDLARRLHAESAVVRSLDPGDDATLREILATYATATDRAFAKALDPKEFVKVVSCDDVGAAATPGVSEGLRAATDLRARPQSP